MQKFLWSVYLSLSLALFGLFLLADCPQDGGCWSCYNNLLDCATNGNGNCSSNCVRFSPEDCTNFLTNAFIRLDAIDSSSHEIRLVYEYSVDLIDNQLLPAVDSAYTNVNNALTALRNFNPTNDVVQSLSRSLSVLAFLHQKTLPVDQSGTTTVYSNRQTGVTTTFSNNSRISFRLALATNYIHLAIDQFSQIESDIINTHSAIEQSLSSASSALEFLHTYLVSLKGTLDNLYLEVYLIDDNSDSLRSELSSVNCEPCGSGGGGGGGSTDFTGVSAKLDEIESLLRQILQLITNFYTDYDYVRAHPVAQAEPSYEVYSSLPNNWFSRVEYLLYSVSPLATNTLDGAEDPETIEGQTSFQYNFDELETSIDEQEQSLSEKATQPMNDLKESFTRLWSKLSVFKSNTDNPDDGLLWSHMTILQYGDPGNGGFRLEASNNETGVVNTFTKLEIAFRFLWFLLTVALYIYFTIAVIKYSFKVASFVVKLLNTTFGSS